MALASVVLPGAAAAQADVGARVGKLESEMRAVQRKVFPGGAGQYVQPEISAAPVAAGPGPGVPATSAVADLTARVASLEGQMATLTGQIEQNQYKLRQLQDAFDAFRRSTDAKLAAVGTAGASPGGASGGSLSDDDGPAHPQPASRPAASRPAPGGASRGDAPTSVDTAAAGDHPATGDAAEDAYMAGYRLWTAKKYPEAEAQLKKVVATYPKSKRASYAQNLLGRSYLDEGKPSLASMAFYDNYKKMPDGERAPDSLYFLAQALVKLNKPADACKVYGELNDVYGAKVSAEMKANVAKGRVAAKCS